MPNLRLQIGVKTDPTQYRYSYEWLFRLLSKEGVQLVQLGTFFEIYQLPDEYFFQVRRTAEDHGIQISSIFTAHRELGGFFVDEPGWEGVARRNFERLIEIGSLLGAQSVGSNPGAVYRDRMGTKKRGTDVYLRHMKELMEYAHARGVPWLCIEPMSCLAEPPTLPDEIVSMAQELTGYHASNPDSTARVGYCTDIAHGYADRDLNIQHDHLELLEATLPFLYEVHLKNTDAEYSSTFGFAEAEREVGIIEIEPVRELLLSRQELLPVDSLIGYLEIGGPKLGRDYSDQDLADQLRESLAYLERVWTTEVTEPLPSDESSVCVSVTQLDKPVRVSPSVMCADLGHLADHVGRIESVGADLLHIDMADGHFVPNLLLGIDAVRAVRRISALPMDVHLMVADPDALLEPLAEIGVEMVAVHAEACRHLDRTLTRIRELGMQAGVALNPATPLSDIEYVLERLDFILLMTVNPGFAGQKLVASGIRKIADCHRLLITHDRRHHIDPTYQGVAKKVLEESAPLTHVTIMVDGNVSFENIPKMVAAGADILVAGTSSWFRRDDTLAANVQKTADAIAAGISDRSSDV